MKLGAIWRDPQPQDDKATGQSRVVYEDRNTSWKIYVPEDNEIQVSLYTETNSCTNHSCSNSIDTQCDWFLEQGKLSQDKIDRLTAAGFIVNGKFNTSEAWNAVKSSTNPAIGNYLYKPWDSARNDGMIPEKLLQFGRYSKKEDFYNWTETQEMLDAAALFKEIFRIQYEIVPTDAPSLSYHLKHAPISIIAGVCPPWDDSIIKQCSMTGGHATLLYGVEQGVLWNDFDSYTPNQKRLEWDYTISYGIKGVVTLVEDLNTFKYHFTLDLRKDTGVHGDSTEIKALQIALFLDGCLYDSDMPTRELLQKFGGYFGENTDRAVKTFQHKYTLPETGVVGPQTRAVLNSLFN